MKYRIITFCLLLGIVSCKKKDKKDTEEPAPVFDKQALVVNLADNVIIPAYAQFKTSLDSLNTALSNFNASFNSADFQSLKQKYSAAYKHYQLISPNEFGPAESVVVRMNFNVFPTDTKQVNLNIKNGGYDLGSVINLDAKGFPALDYLLYGVNSTEDDMIQKFQSNSARRQYATDVVQDMVTKTKTVLDTWNASYRSTFVNSLGTDVGSSIGFVVNQLNFELDYLKNAKIGIPLGKKSLDVPMPSNCEAYYGAQSVEFALETLTAIENMYLGRGLNGVDGKGFDDYLDHLDAKYNGGSLNNAIKQQFNTARTKLKNIPDPLSIQVTSNSSVVNAAYTELVKLLVLLKTDMPSNLGVVITYQDGDGD